MNRNPSDANGLHGFTGFVGREDGGPSSAVGGHRKVQGMRGFHGAKPPGLSESGTRKGSRGPPGDRRNHGKHADVDPHGGRRAQAVPIGTAIQGLMDRVATLEKQVVILQGTASLYNYHDPHIVVKPSTPALLCLCSTIDLDRLSPAQRKMLRQSLSPQVLATSGDSVFSSNFFQAACNAFLTAGISLYSRTQIAPTGISESGMVVVRPQDLGFWNYWNYLAEDPYIDFEIRSHARILCNGYCNPIFGTMARELDRDIQFYIYTTVMEVYRYLA